MKIGFTGTREGMTEPQQMAVLELIRKLNPTEAHHGDCVGADKEFNGLCNLVSWSRPVPIKTVAHPPKNPTLRAFCLVNETREPKDYMPRNFDIVNDTDELIAAPKQMEKPKILKGSGTWQTEDYAEGKHKTVYIVWPNGEVEEVSRALAGGIIT